MKSILMSIKWNHNSNIEKGLKKSELRTQPPKIEPPFKVYTYESGCYGRRVVVNEWICKDITTWRIYMGIPAHLPSVACVSTEEIKKYSHNGRKNISEMEISHLKIYDKPKELGEFRKAYELDSEGFIKCGSTCTNLVRKCEYSNCATLQKLYPKITRPPQSWQYVNQIVDVNKTIEDK